MNIKEQLKSISLILLSAGKGKRYGKKKQFELLNHQPIFQHSINTFLRFKEVKEIIMVVSKEDVNYYQDYFNSNNIKEILKENLVTLKIVNGGKERFLSVINGLEKVSISNDFVFIHDAARPLIHYEDVKSIIKILDKSKENLGILPVELVKDSMKMVEIIDNCEIVKENLVRNNIRIASTPQVFPRENIVKAYEDLKVSLQTGKEYFPTDDSEVFSKYRGKVMCYLLRFSNPKLTIQEDFLYIEGLLNQRV